jgi:anaerobic ribonucleoside-triphosphate reductase
MKNIDEQIAEIEAKINDPLLCNETAETYSRISGYYRPVNQWNEGKKTEFSERLEYSLNS